MSKLSEIVNISAAFTNEVNIRIDSKTQRNRSKVRGYVPTQQTAKALEVVVRGVMPSSDERVHTITGAYGTGKSHFGLLLANLLAQWDEESLEEFWNKFANKFAEESKFIKTRLDLLSNQFLVVIPNHDPMRDFNQTMLTALSEALNRESIDYTPKSLFQEALNTIKTWDSSDIYHEPLQEKLAVNQSSVPIISARLEKYDYEAYELWQHIYREVTLTGFSPALDGDVVEIYKNTINDLSNRIEGIFVLYDEFGVYLRDAANSPDNKQTIQIQNFAEYCKNSRSEQCHFLIIAHQTLSDYGAGHRTSKDWEKVYGRFTGKQEITMAVSSTSEAGEELLDTVIVQNTDLDNWNTVTQHSDLTLLQDWCEDIKLYNKSGEWIREVVLEGCFPLHPAATFALPWLSERVGQSHRTLFTFLSTDDNKSLSKFVSEQDVLQNDRLNLFTLDMLFYYFESGIQKAEYRNITRARDEVLTATNFDPMVERIINLLCIYEIVKQPAIRPTQDLIPKLLHLSPNQETDCIELLNHLVDKRLLRQRQSDGEYELRIQQGDINAQDAINLMIERLRDSFVESKALQRMLKTHNRLKPFIPNKYEDTFFIKRTVVPTLVELGILDNIDGSLASKINEWYSPNNRSNYQGDALLLYILAIDESEINTVISKLHNVNWESQNIIIAIPTSPLLLGNSLLQLEAIDRIKQNAYKLDDQNIDTDDLQAIKRDIQESIAERINEFLSIENFTYIDSHGNHANDRTSQQSLESLFTDFFTALFHATPIIKDIDIMSRTGSRDKTKKARTNIMDKLLTSRGLLRIGKSGGSENRIMGFCLRDSQILKQVRDLGGEEEFEVREQLPEQSPLFNVWIEISNYFDISTASENKNFRIFDIVHDLLLPPYGLSHQFVDLLFASYFRRHRDNFLIFSGVKRAKKASDLNPVNWDGDAIYNMVSNPEDYLVSYVFLKPDQRDYLEEINNIFEVQTDVRLTWDNVKDNILRWFAQLPNASKILDNYEDATIKNYIRFLDKIAEEELDSKDALWGGLPQALGIPNPQNENMQSELQRTIDRMETTPNRIMNKVVEDLSALFEVDGKTVGALEDGARRWYDQLTFKQRDNDYANPHSNYLLGALSVPDVEFIDCFFVDLPEKMHIGNYSDWTFARVQTFIVSIRDAASDIEHQNYRTSSSNQSYSNTDENSRDSAKRMIIQTLRNLDISAHEIKTLLQHIIDEWES